MIGLPKSLSFIPVARHRPRAPAMLRPWVVVRERYEGIFGNPDNFISKTNEETRLYTPIRADSMQLCCTCEKAAAQTAPAPPLRLPDPAASRSLHRSEEHTSELQSLMRISYAVLC